MLSIIYPIICKLFMLPHSKPKYVHVYVYVPVSVVLGKSGQGVCGRAQLQRRRQ